MEHKCLYDDTIPDIKKTLYGNGQKGLFEKVTSLQIQMKIVLAGISFIIGLLIKLIFFGG
jgi:hypothetical protein